MTEIWTIDALKEHLEKLVDGLENHLTTVREDDRRAVELAHTNLSKRLEGFPQQYATKPEQETLRAVLQRVERDAISREIYDANHSALQDQVSNIDRHKLSESVFDSFVENYRRDQELELVERRTIAAAVASAATTAAVAEKTKESTWSSIRTVVITTATIITLFITVIVFVANYIFQQ